MSAPQSRYRGRMIYLLDVHLFENLFLCTFIFSLKVVKIERIITKIYVFIQQNL